MFNTLFVTNFIDVIISSMKNYIDSDYTINK